MPQSIIITNDQPTYAFIAIRFPSSEGTASFTPALAPQESRETRQASRAGTWH
jgi:hypothetical protein